MIDEDKIVYVDDDGHGWTQDELDEAEVKADISNEGALEDDFDDDDV